MRKIVYLFLLLLFITFSNAQTIEKIYNFDNYQLENIDDYQLIEIDGCLQSALKGQPSLPWYPVSIMLPQGCEAESIEVVCSDYKEIEIEKSLFPYQPSRAYSSPERTQFYIDENVYLSKTEYPSSKNGVLTTHHMNGYALANSTFTPIKYIPSEGKAYMAQTVKVTITHKAMKSYNEKMVSSRPEVRKRLETLVDNPEMIDNYIVDKSKSVEGYELLIITSSEYMSDFQPYIDFYNTNDIRTNIMTTEYIFSSVQGVDNQEKIRNCIISEYETSDITMVLLGGDVAIVPYRGFYGDVLSGGSHNIDDNIPADLYFAALDGSWNDDGDELWGEIGEDDLYPEIGIARFPFNNLLQLNNMMHKTLSYQQDPVYGEFRKVILGGEHLHDYPNTNGSDYLELIIGNHDDNGYYTEGIPEDYDITRLYAEDNNWSGAKLRDAIVKGTGYVHHVGHANTDFVAGWYGSSVTSDYFAESNGVDHNYTFFHSHGCDCANFPSSSVMEKLVTISTFAVATIGNSRYGWFNEGQTEGPSCHLHREMTDAFWADRIPYLGLALTDSKCQTAPFVNAPGQWEEGALRWNFYDLNIMGDVAVKPWHDEPFRADVHYDKAFVQGTTSTKVRVSYRGENLANYRCSIYKDDIMLGYSITDENGEAVIELSEPINFVGEACLKVSGMNSFTRIFNIDCINDDEPYVYIDRLIVDDSEGNNNGIIDFGEYILLNAVVKNVGKTSTNDMNLAIRSCSTDYFTIVDEWEELDSIEAQTEVTINGAFSLKINNDIPDGHVITVNMTCDDYYHYWYSSAELIVSAPELDIEYVQLDDSQGNNNGLVDPGETIVVRVSVSNLGTSNAENAVLSVEYDDSYINFLEDSYTIDVFESKENVQCEFSFIVSDDVPEGYACLLTTVIVSGRYNDTFVRNIEVGRTVDSFETADFSKVPWVLYGDSNWFVTDEESYDGVYSARSGDIDDDELSSIGITINHVGDPDTLSFYLKVSSEERSDYLAFFINDEMQDWWSGEMDWTKFSYVIPEGTFFLEWRYDKSQNGTSGDDCAWIDKITFPVNSGLTMNTGELATPALNIDVYPNPSNGLFNVNIYDADANVKIFNSLGQMILEKNHVTGNVSLDLGCRNPGLYIMRITDENGNSLIRKIIVR